MTIRIEFCRDVTTPLTAARCCACTITKPPQPQPSCSLDLVPTPPLTLVADYIS